MIIIAKLLVIVKMKITVIAIIHMIATSPISRFLLVCSLHCEIDVLCKNDKLINDNYDYDNKCYNNIIDDFYNHDKN